MPWFLPKQNCAHISNPPTTSLFTSRGWHSNGTFEYKKFLKKWFPEINAVLGHSSLFGWFEWHVPIIINRRQMHWFDKPALLKTVTEKISHRPRTGGFLWQKRSVTGSLSVLTLWKDALPLGLCAITLRIGALRLDGGGRFVQRLFANAIIWMDARTVTDVFRLLCLLAHARAPGV